MRNAQLAAATITLSCVATLACAGPPPPAGGRYAYPGGPYRAYYPPVRPVYPGWSAGYWGPRAGIYVGGPGYYWGAWPYAWGAAYAVPYAVPVPQVVVQPPVMTEVPAASYWYYCTQPAGYYPYVQNCGQPWMRVVPQAPGSTNAPPQLAP